MYGYYPYYGMGYGGYYFSWTYLLVIAGVIICLAAQAKLKNTYNKYSRVRSLSGMTGAQAAMRILSMAGINDVEITHVKGSLTDHYNPMNKTLALSDTVYNNRSVAAVGVAAHECGHAIQHQVGYFPLRFRGAMVPVTKFCSWVSWPLIVFGAIIGGSNSLLLTIGIWMFSITVLFQLVTLPVEFNASHRAMRELERTGVLGSEELHYTRKVLTAAAMTYVASAASIILQLLRLLIMFGGGGRRR